MSEVLITPCPDLRLLRSAFRGGMATTASASSSASGKGASLLRCLLDPRLKNDQFEELFFIGLPLSSVGEVAAGAFALAATLPF